MLLQKIYQNRSKRLTQLLSKATKDLSNNERKELLELINRDSSKANVHR